MADKTLAEVNAALDTLQGTIDTEQQEVANALAEFEAVNAELRAQIEAGANSLQLGDLADRIDAIIADVRETIPNLPEPEEPVEPPVE